MVDVANSARTGPSNIFIREFRSFGKLPWLTNLPSFGMLAVDAGSLVASMLSIQQNIILTQKNHAVTGIPCDAAHVVLCVVFTHRPSCACGFVYIAKPPPLILSCWSPFIKVSSVCKVWQRFCFKPMRNWDPFSPLSLVFKKGVTHQPQIEGYNCTKLGENHLLNNKVKVRTK